MGRFYYSPGFKNFFVEGIHDSIPDDKIEVSEEQHAELIDGRSNGMRIEIEDGVPVLVKEDGPSDEDLARAARMRRDRLLASSDRFMLVDAPIAGDLQQAWADYRKALRDIPAQSTFPKEIQWPVEPA